MDFNVPKNKDDSDKANKVLEYINTCQQFSASNIDYHFFTDSIKELSGAALVELNLVSEEDSSKTIVKAVSGAPERLSKLMKFLGSKLEGSEWEAEYEAIKLDEKNKLIYYSSFKEIGYYDALPRLAPVLKAIEKYLFPGGMYVIEFDYQEEFLGIITLFMPKGKKLENKELLELYIYQISGIIKRLRAENMLQKKVQALQESESRFKAYMEKSPLGIFIANHEGRYIGVNREACQMSGYTEEELLNLSIPDFLDPEFLEKGIKNFERLQSDGYAEEDIMARKKDGKTFWINLSAVKIGNEAIAFCQDITERKMSEERAKELNCLHTFSRLLQDNNNLENILEETAVLLPPSFQYPEDTGACITYKGREYKTKNYKPTRWKISSHLELNDAQTGIIEVCYLKTPLHDQEPFSKEERLMLGTIAGHLSRVTKQIQAEEDLLKSKNKLSITLQSIGDGVIGTDNSGKITRMNPQAEKLTGWKEEEALGRSVYEVFHIEDATSGELVHNPVFNVINSGKTDNLADNTLLVNRSGTKCPIADSAAPILDDDGRMLGVVMVFSDVTQRKKAEESLQNQFRFEKMLSDISSTFATQSSDQLEKNINYALMKVGEFFQVERSYVFLFSDDGNQVSSTYEWCAEGIEALVDELQGVPVDAFPWWIDQIKNKKNVIIPDVDNLPHEAEAEKKLLKPQKVRSLLTIPMMNNGIVFGFLGIDAVQEKKSWTESQIMLLTLVTELVSNAYSRKLAEERVRYNSLHDSLTGLYNRFYLENEMEKLDTERQLPIGIMMIDLNGFKMVNDTFGHDVGDQMLKKTAEILCNSCRREDVIARWGGDEFVIFLPQTTEEAARAISQRIDENCKNHHVKDIPISMAIGYAIKDTADKDLADILKEAEDNMYKDKFEESQQAKSNVLNARLKELETKSFEPEDHYVVMQNVAYKIGKKKGLSQLDFEKLKKLISLHDIGKVKIPEEILTKKGPLTAEEWDIVKKHPETGYMIARSTEEFAQVAEDILCHREHWDGSGYPQGLKGNEIPLLARITAIADAYEVMSTGRAYKEALPKSDIIAELKRCAGSQFDPELIEIFLLLTKDD